VNYRTDDLTARITEITDGRGVDLIYDPVGGDTAAMALKSLARNGRIAMMGLSSGAPVPIDLIAVAGRTGLAQAAPGKAGSSPDLLPDPATAPVPNPPFPTNISHQELTHLQGFDQLDFDVFSHADWARLRESHAQNIRAHWPDGHYTDGLDQHIADLEAQFAWAPDTRIQSHPIRIAMNELTAVTGVMQGTFTQPMADGKGGFIQPTGKVSAPWRRREQPHGCPARGGNGPPSAGTAHGYSDRSCAAGALRRCRR
jgi:hypothetical protein